MNTDEKLNNIYKLFEEKKYVEAMEKVQEILSIQPENIYAKRYENLLKPYLNDKSSVGKIVTIKGKNLKCPHCDSAISFSALNEEQKTKIRENNYENLSLKCPYCHTTFTLQKKSENSIIGIKIGDKINYKNKNYRVVGAVNYAGNWYEGYYSGTLNYLEWILLGDDNSYLYFSEGYFYDDGEKKYEFEFSEKIIPNFDVEFKNEKSLFISGFPTKVSEKNDVTAQSLYGENSKVFTVGERVELYEFEVSGKNYVLEKERAGRQAEAGIYETWSVSKSKAFEIFGKEISSYDKVGNIYEYIKDYFSYIFLGLFFGIPILTSYGIKIEYIFFIIIFLILGFFSFVLGFYKSKLFHIFFSGPIFAGLVFFMGNNFFENRQEISLKDITEGKKYEILFSDESLMQTSPISTKRYDYGGVETTYNKIKGFNFSVLNEEDKEIIEKLKTGKDIPEETQKIFSQNIYKLK